MENNLEKLINDNSLITISLDKAYASSDEFWNENKALVYSKIIEIFEKFLESDEEDILGITVATKIEGDEKKIYFGFDKYQPEILIDLLMPYYIGEENYEVCARLRDIYNLLERMKEYRECKYS